MLLRSVLAGLILVLSPPAAAATRRQQLTSGGHPGAPVPIDFVPESFSFRARVAALSPAPAGDANKTVRTLLEWGWGNKAGETRGYGWGEYLHFTRNVTGASWAKSYPNNYGLPKQFSRGGPPWTPKFEDTILVTHLFVCHLGEFPCNHDRYPNSTCTLDANQTTTVELQIELEGKSFELSATLEWGAEEGSCDDLGIVVGQTTSTSAHFVETFQQYNARKYWAAFDALPKSRAVPKQLAIMDMIRTGDGDLQAKCDAMQASQRLGLHGVAGQTPAWLQQQELGYTLTSAGSDVALFDYSPYAPNTSPSRHAANLSEWAKSVAIGQLADGFKRDEIRNTPIHDEPGFTLPRDLPPVGNASFAAVTTRWVEYLKGQGLSPSDLGSESWSDVAPSMDGWHEGSLLQSRTLYYHSLKFTSLDSSIYLAKATRALEAELVPEATIYVNWNNMGAHWYFPNANGTGQLNHDWFVHARVRGGTQLWTEDWFGDGLSWQWSYYAALMSSATRLAAPFEGTREFGGYVVPRSSGGRVEGALLRRVISLVGGGSKGMTYFTFGPEYNFPGNCYSDEAALGKILAEQQQAHELIGMAEPVLWPARRLASRVAILAHRSANAWDPVGTNKWENQTEHTMTYQADQFGLYLALAVHGGFQVDFLDEDAAQNATVMDQYGVLLITEPNVPKATIKQLSAWVNGGGTLVVSGGAAVADEYNSTDNTLASLTGCEMTPFPRRLLPEVRQLPGPSPLPFAANGSITSSSGVKKPVTMFGDASSFAHIKTGSKVLGTFDGTDAPCAVQSTVGTGSIVQIAWQPGLSYLINATQEFYVPNPVTQFPAAIREFLVETVLAAAGPPAVTLTESDGTKVVGVETILLSSSTGAVVTVINWGGVPVSEALLLTLNLVDAGFGEGAKVGQVLDASTGQHVAPTKVSQASITVSITAVLANMIVFPRAGDSPLSLKSDDIEILRAADRETQAVSNMTVHQTVPYFGESYVLIEAENFTTDSSSGGWRAMGWGDGNYFASTLNNVFASRRALLSSDANASHSSCTATAVVSIPQSGTFSVLARYEGIFHFNTGFRVKISQAGQTVFDRVYGLRSNLKLWGFVTSRMAGRALSVPGSCGKGELLTAECSWTYGATEGWLWEGIGANVQLEQGTAEITLTRDSATESDDPEGSPEANRNIDMIVLHPNQTDVTNRALVYEVGHLSLPLDGYATQQGEVYARFTNLGQTALNLTLSSVYSHSGAAGNHLTLPFWDNVTNALVAGCSYKGDQTFIHAHSEATFKPADGGPRCPRVLLPTTGQSSDWIEVGSLLDTYNHGTWNFPCGTYKVDIGIASSNIQRNGGGSSSYPNSSPDIEQISTFSAHNTSLQLQVDASTRATRRVRDQHASFFSIVDAMEQHTKVVPLSPHGKKATNMPFYARAFAPDSELTGGLDVLVSTAKPSTYSNPPTQANYNATVAKFLSWYPKLEHGDGGLNNSERFALSGPFLGAPYCAFNAPPFGCEHQLNATLTERIAAGALDNPGTLVIEVTDELRMGGIVGKGSNSSKSKAFNNCTSTACVDGLFADWAKTRQIKDVKCPGGHYNSSVSMAIESPRCFSYSTMFLHDTAIMAYKAFTDATLQRIPLALVGANFSPDHMHGSPVFQFIRAFREGSFNLPWAEDWIWQIPVGTPQQVSLVLHQFQAGLRNYSSVAAEDVTAVGIPAPSRPIVMYVMALAPGQTPSGWRRSIFTSIAHGVKYVRNYRIRDSLDAIDGGCYADPEAVGRVPYAGMYHQTRATLWELGGMDDIVWEGTRLWGSKVAMLMSESTDNWQPANVARQFAEASTSGPAGGYIQASDRWGTLGSERASLFILLQHAQLQLDIVTEDDILNDHLGQYSTLFMAESHVSQAATTALAKWVAAGHTLCASAAAGGKDEFNATNHAMQQLLGIKHMRTEVDKQGIVNGTIDFVKQNLPFASAIDSVALNGSTIDVVGWKSHFTTVDQTAIEVLGRFSDTSPAITRRSVGSGHAMYIGFLPGLSYFKPAIPKRPVSRGPNDDDFNHFLPTEFNVAVRDSLVLGLAIDDVARTVGRPVLTSEPLVDHSAIVSKHGLMVPLINWVGKSVHNLQIQLREPIGRTYEWGSAVMISGGSVAKIGSMEKAGVRTTTFRVDALDVADALVLR